MKEMKGLWTTIAGDFHFDSFHKESPGSCRRLGRDRHYASATWLEEFADRIPLGVDLFVMGGGMALAVAVSTVAYLGLRAARMNPVDALRYE